MVPEFLRYTIYNLYWSWMKFQCCDRVTRMWPGDQDVTRWPGRDQPVPKHLVYWESIWLVSLRIFDTYRSNSGTTPWGTLTIDSSWTLKFAGWKFSIFFQIASMYGYLYVKFQWGKSKKFRSSWHITSWKLQHESRCILYICPIGQLGDMFCSVPLPDVGVRVPF